MMRKILTITVMMVLAACSAFCLDWTEGYENSVLNKTIKAESFQTKLTDEQYEEIMTNHAEALNTVCKKTMTGELQYTYPDCQIFITHSCTINKKGKVIEGSYTIGLYSHEDFIMCISSDLGDKINDAYKYIESVFLPQLEVILSK